MDSLKKIQPFGQLHETYIQMSCLLFRANIYNYTGLPTKDESIKTTLRECSRKMKRGIGLRRKIIDGDRY